MNEKLRSSLTWKEGTAMSISAVIGCGILILPASTAQKCGPASLMVWTAVSLLCFPIVYVLGCLAAKIPKAGGIASYAEKAFGREFSGITTWILMGSIPIGLPGVALSGAYYLGYIFPLNFTQLIMLSALMLYMSVFLNIKGIDISSKVSSFTIILIISIIIFVSLLSLRHVDTNNFSPFMPHGLNSVLSSFSLIFFAFSGFEMICPLAEEFKNPKRDIKISLMLAALFIAILYILLSFVTIGTASYKDTHSFTFLSSLISISFGKASGYAIAFLTILITFCSIHACIAGFSRIIYNGACINVFPKFLSKIHSSYKTPVNALLMLGTIFTFVLLFFAFACPDLNVLLKFPGSVFLFSYILAMAFGIKLLNKYSIGWFFSIISFILCSLFFILSGFISLFPIALGLAGYLYLKFKSKSVSLNSVDNSINKQKMSEF